MMMMMMMCTAAASPVVRSVASKTTLSSSLSPPPAKKSSLSVLPTAVKKSLLTVSPPAAKKSLSSVSPPPVKKSSSSVSSPAVKKSSLSPPAAKKPRALNAPEMATVIDLSDLCLVDVSDDEMCVECQKPMNANEHYKFVILIYHRCRIINIIIIIIEQCVQATTSIIISSNADCFSERPQNSSLFLIVSFLTVFGF